MDGPGRILVEFTTDKDIDLRLANKDDLSIKVESLDGSFKAKTKTKMYSGYINDKGVNEYGMGRTFQQELIQQYLVEWEI